MDGKEANAMFREFTNLKCKDCEHWTALNIQKQHWGDCAMVGVPHRSDGKEEGEPLPNDRLLFYPSEPVYFGAEYGCIHWEGKDV